VPGPTRSKRGIAMHQQVPPPATTPQSNAAAQREQTELPDTAAAGTADGCGSDTSEGDAARIGVGK